MAMFEFVLDDTFVGQTIGPADGYLVNLSRTKSPSDDGPPRAAPDGTWLSGKLQLRGTRDVRDLVCTDSLDVGSWIGRTKTIVANSSYPYNGGLLVRAVPKGAVYEVTLSDQENIRTVASDTGAKGVRRAQAIKLAATEPLPKPQAPAPKPARKLAPSRTRVTPKPESASAI
jgi:hypothetical protein